MKLKFWFPFLVYSVIIFSVSSLPNERVMPITRFFWDKLLHVIEYIPLGIAAFYAFRNTAVSWNINKQRICSFILCVLYAISDEWHQSFVPGRQASLPDVLADTIGIVIGIIGYIFLETYLKQRKAHVSH